MKLSYPTHLDNNFVQSILIKVFMRPGFSTVCAIKNPAILYTADNICRGSYALQDWQNPPFGSYVQTPHNMWPTIHRVSISISNLWWNYCNEERRLTVLQFKFNNGKKSIIFPYVFQSIFNFIYLSTTSIHFEYL